MKYKVIIENLKETADPNVLAFLKDVENKKRLSRNDRQNYMARLHEPGVAEIIRTARKPRNLLFLIW